MTARADLASSPFRELIELQAGVLARRQWLALGQTSKAWNWQLRLGNWTALIPGVAVLHSGPPEQLQYLWAAVLHAGTDAALHGDAGLVQHGFRLRELPAVQVAVPFPRRVVGGRLVGGPLLVCKTLPAQDPLAVRASGPPTVEPHFAVLRAAEWASSDRSAEWRIAAAVQQGVTTPALIREALGAVSDVTRGWLLRAVLDDVEHGAHAASELEFLRFLRLHGLPEPDQLQVLVRTESGKRYLDARYKRQRTTVEVDGAHHRDVEEWEADALRTLELAVARRGSGETLIRITTGNMRHDGPKVAGLLAALLQ